MNNSDTTDGTHELFLLQKLDVGQVQFDTELTLVLNTPAEQHSSIRIGTEFLCTIDNATSACNPREPRTLSPALILVGKIISSARYSSQGDLHVEFTDESSLRVPCNTQYEAWQVVTLDDTLFIATPNQSVAIFNKQKR